MTTTPNALGDRSNWVFAALNVGFWNLAGFVGLAVPVAAFEGSIKQTPVKQPDGSWIWTYSITVQGVTYTAELHGKYTILVFVGICTLPKRMIITIIFGITENPIQVLLKVIGY